jgi:hypothetical protein
MRLPDLVAAGHLDDERWNDDDVFERGLDALLTTPEESEHG